MISEKNRCIFVHIPKTGGSSIEDAIWGLDRNQRTTGQLWFGSNRSGFNKYQTGGLQHLLATQIRTEVGQEKFEGYFKFSFVRNPWDKVVSQYHYIKTRPKLMQFMGLPKHWLTFQRYLRTLQTSHLRHVQSYEQWRFIQDERGTELVDFVGRFENLQRDFDIISARLGIAPARLPHAEKSRKRKPYPAYYSRRTRQLVADIYAADIEAFGYRFED